MKVFRFKKTVKKPKWVRGFDVTKSIFIHVPKSAGTSISNALYGEDPWHHTALEYRRFFRRKMLRYFTFAFVRNPYERILSTYLYSFVQKERNPWTSVGFVTEFKTFEDFVLGWITPDHVNDHYFFLPQEKYLVDEEGRILVDYVGRLETINEDYLFVERKLGVKIGLKDLNKTDHVGYRGYYTSEMRSVVESSYQEDFELFKYSF